MIMKKIFYSLAIMVMGLASCTTWDDAVTEKYGDGPSIDVNVVAAQPSDSAFTITLTPAAGTTYYAFIIDESPEAETIDGYTLLKGGYGNSVVNTSQYPTLTLPIDGAEPNTTYQVYAVASNDKGIIGDVVVKSITTTDKNAPKPMTLKEDAANKAVQVGFNQAVKRGTGAVKAVYYKEWDWENPVTVNPEDIEVTISGKTVTFSVPNAPAGSFIAFSWEKGAFVDAVGNQCTAFTSSYDEKNDKFLGIWVHAANEAFEVTDKNVTAPKDKEFDNWEAFAGELTFDFDIFRNDETVEAGDLEVVYSGKKRTATYKLTAEQWSVSGKKLTFKLPEAPNSEETVALKMVEGAINDVYGNPNAEYTSTITWKYSTFQPTVDNVIGTFDFIYTSAYDGGQYDGGPVTITEDPENENGVIIKGLFSDYVPGGEFEGYYDLSASKLYIYAYQVLGLYTASSGTVYGLITYSQTYKDEIEFTINADGTITSTDLGLVACDENYEDALGWMEKASIATLTPKAAAARSWKASSKAKSKAKKVNTAVRNLKKHIRK